MYYSSIPELYITLLYVKYRTIISRPSFTAGHGVRISFQYILLLCLWQLPVTIQQWGSRLTGCSGISRSTFSLGCRAYDYCCPAFQLCYRNLCKENAELLKFSSPSLSPQGIAAGWIQRWDEWNQQENTDRGCRLTLPRALSDLKKKGTDALSIPRSTPELTAALALLENACLCFPEKRPSLSSTAPLDVHTKVITRQPFSIKASKVILIFPF